MPDDKYTATMTDGTELVLLRKEQLVQIRQEGGRLAVHFHADDLDELALAIADLIQGNEDW